MRRAYRLLAPARRAPEQCDIDCAFRAFGLPRTATLEHVKKRYHRLAVTTHPDRGGSATRFNEIKEHYEVLARWLGKGVADDLNDEDVKAFVRELEVVVERQHQERFQKMVDRALESNCLLTSTKLLYLTLDAGALYHPLGMQHTVLLLRVIARWEVLNEMTATHDIFNNLIYPYAFEKSTALDDREMLFKCVTRIVEEMQQRDIDVDGNWWTKRLVINSLVRDVHQLRSISDGGSVDSVK